VFCVAKDHEDALFLEDNFSQSDDVDVMEFSVDLIQRRAGKKGMKWTTRWSARELLPSFPPRFRQTHSNLPDSTLTDSRISNDLSFLIWLELLDSVELSFLSFEIARTSRSSWIERGSRWFQTSFIDSSVRSRGYEAHDEVAARGKYGGQGEWKRYGEQRRWRKERREGSVELTCRGRSSSSRPSKLGRLA